MIVVIVAVVVVAVVFGVLGAWVASQKGRNTTEGLSSVSCSPSSAS